MAMTSSGRAVVEYSWGFELGRSGGLIREDFDFDAYPDFVQGWLDGEEAREAFHNDALPPIEKIPRRFSTVCFGT